MKKRAFAIIVFISLFLGGIANGAQPPSVCEIKIPDYRVNRTGNLDYVDIPGGEILIAEEGRPRIPYYIKIIDCPKGYQVQDVILKERTGTVTASGLNLPVVILNPNPPAPVEMKEGLYPEKNYEWRVWRNPDGSATLVISVYPFYYNPKTTDVKFHKKYRLEIKYIETTVSITRLMADKKSYEPGENTIINVKLESRGKPQDITVSGVVRREFTNDTVGELSSKELKGVSKSDSVALQWQPIEVTAGDYYIEVSLKDAAGNVQDREVERIRLGGIPVCELTDFKVTPEHFKIGDDIQLSLELKNTGFCDISGTAVFDIKHEGVVVEKSVHDFSKLTPGKALHFTHDWHTKEAVKAALYYVLGYVKYEGAATMPRKAVISTNLMPVASLTFSPEKPVAGSEVSFDAAGSKDSDGSIAEYNWDFGDGGTDSGNKVTHTYYLQGNYEITLVVKDNENGTCEIKQKIAVAGDK